MRIGYRLGFEMRVDEDIGRTLVRHGVMGQLARTSWGFEVGIHRSTHKVLITSLAGYGLSAVGSFLCEALISRLEAQSANVAARRISGVSRAARLEVRHPAADILSARNQYVQQGASLLDRWLRAHGSSIKAEMERYLCARFGVAGWGVETRVMKVVIEGRIPR